MAVATLPATQNGIRRAEPAVADPSLAPRVRGALLAAAAAPGVVDHQTVGRVATVTVVSVRDRTLEAAVDVPFFKLTNAARELLRAAGMLPWRVG
jgi:hypothetical protein